MPDSPHHETFTSRPVPDPTLLTTEALHREISYLEKFLLAELKNSDRFFSEKFKTIEEYRIEQKKDSKDGIAAALQAAKEAVNEQTLSSNRSVTKSEGATKEKIDQQAVLISSTKENLEGRINDLKDRLTRIEGQSKGISDMFGWIVAGVTLVILVATYISSHNSPQGVSIQPPATVSVPNGK